MYEQREGRKSGSSVCPTEQLESSTSMSGIVCKNVMQTTCHGAGFCNMRRKMHVILITTILSLPICKMHPGETGLHCEKVECHPTFAS